MAQPPSASLIPAHGGGSHLWSPAGCFRRQHLHSSGCCPPQAELGAPLLALFGQSDLLCCWGQGGWCLGKVFLSVGGGRDPLAGRSKSSSSACVKGQLWRERPEAKGVGATCVRIFQEYGKGWNSECHFDAGTRTAHRFTAVMGLSSSPGLSVSPGLAHTQDNCSW